MECNVKSCKNTPCDGFKSCLRCRKRAAEYKRKKRTASKAQGICGRCAVRKCEENKQSCRRCLNRENGYVPSKESLAKKKRKTSESRKRKYNERSESRENEKSTNATILTCTRCGMRKQNVHFVRPCKRSFYRFCDECRNRSCQNKHTQTRNTIFEAMKEFINEQRLCCSVCGRNDPLEFDHVDRSTKCFKLTDIRYVYNKNNGLLNTMKTAWLEEFAKCQVLCPYHHRLKSRTESLKTKPKRPRHTLKKRYFVTLQKLRDEKCVSCGLKVTLENSCAFDYDHRDPVTKSFSLSTVGRSIYPPEHVILEEIQKCDLKCANCHVLRTKNHW